jgi:hypothetical protein
MGEIGREFCGLDLNQTNSFALAKFFTHTSLNHREFLSYKKYVLFVDVDSTLGSLHHVDGGSVADNLEAHNSNCQT